MTDAQIVAVLRDSIPDLIAVYRFGSTTGVQTHAQSDIDVAVLAAQPIEPIERFQVQERLAQHAGRDVDLVDLRNASTVMRMQVISSGLALAVYDPVAHESFADLVYSDYARLNEERREILEQVRREGRIHGR